MNKADGDDIEPRFCECKPTRPIYMDGAVSEVEPGVMWCECRGRAQVTLDAELLLKSFPFDVQSANIIIEAYLYDVDELVWVPVPSISAGLIPPQGRGGVPGWDIASTSATVSEEEYPIFNETYSRLKLSLRLARIPDFYISKYVWGVVFLVAMALLVLLVPGNEPDRLGFVQSSFLGIVSWQFVIVSSTPVTGCAFAARPSSRTLSPASTPTFLTRP